MLPRSLIYLRADEVGSSADSPAGAGGSASSSKNHNGVGGRGGPEAWNVSQHPEEGFKGLRQTN